MDDNINQMSRESKKERLREQIVPEPGKETQESQQEIRAAHRSVIRKRLRIAGIVLAVVAVFGIGIYYYDIYHQYTGYQVAWEKEFASNTAQDDGQSATESGVVGYETFGSGLLKYSKDGASYIDSRGKVVWNLGYEMKSPIVSINGEYAAIADQQGTSVYICNLSGEQGQATTLLPIQRVTISAKGVTAVLEENSSASYINMFHRDGSDLAISVKSLLSGDGYPIDLNFSPDGAQLVVPYLYIDGGILKSKVVFYNFVLGKDNGKRIVGSFYPEALGEGMVSRAHFMDDDHCVLFSDKGLVFVSTRVQTQPSAQVPVEIAQKILTIDYTSQYVALITENAEGSEPYRLYVYRKDGSKVMDTPFNFQYSKMNLQKDRIYLYNESACQVYNLQGVKKLDATFDFMVSTVGPGSLPGTMLILNPSSIKEIKLQ